MVRYGSGRVFQEQSDDNENSLLRALKQRLFDKLNGVTAVPVVCLALHCSPFWECQKMFIL